MSADARDPKPVITARTDGLSPPPIPAVAPDAALPDILTRLRLETRTEHDAIDSTLKLTSPTLSRSRYCQILSQFFGFYQPLEVQLLQHGLTSDWLLPRLGKTQMLEQDLACFGIDNTRLPVCKDLPTLKSTTDLLGCLYVLEGSTLGGQLISRHLRDRLDITPDAGGRFFHGYGDETGRMWRRLREVLVTSVTSGDNQDLAVQSATATFTSLRRWCNNTKIQHEWLA
jgi:heme oxygenase (biliverdin-IX-beta and delta-forming)